MPRTAPQLSGLLSRRFAPLFVTAVLGVFNDNLVKTALLMMASYTVYRAEPAKAAELAMIATGLFIAPFCVFSAFAGEVADRLERTRIVRVIKLCEVAILGLGAVGFLIQSIPLLLAAVALMGVHSAFFGPLKYAILPEHLRADELLAGTGMMEAGGFLAILGGQLIAEVLRPAEAGLLALGLAGAGLVFSLFIPPTRTPAPGPLDFNLPRLSWRLVAEARKSPRIWRAILAIAWFWAVGAVLLAEVVPMVSGVFHAEPSVAALFLAIFSVGVAAGALLVGRLLKGEISSRYAAPAAALLAVCLLDLAFGVSQAASPGRDLSLAAFLARPAAVRILFDLAGAAVAGGVFVIPFYALLQEASPPDARSRILAANNVVNALTTAAALGAAALAVKLGLNLALVLALLALLALGVAGALSWESRVEVLRGAVRAVLRLLYRVEVEGAEHMPTDGRGAVVVANHVSYIDGVILGAFLPGRPTFAVHAAVARTWWMKPLMPLINGLPVDATHAMATKTMVKAVQGGSALIVFPEGRLTVTGALMKVFAGPAMIADKAQAPLIPVRLEGPQYTPFSHLKGKLRLRAFPKIRVIVRPPARLDLDAPEAPRERRRQAAESLYDLMTETSFAAAQTARTLTEALADAARLHGRRTLILEDATRRPLSYERLEIGALLLAARFKAIGAPGDAVGLLLPNVAPALVAFFALLRAGRTPAMLNYAAGPRAMRSACETAEVETIISSRAFIAGAKLEAAVSALEARGRRLLWLEDLVGGFSPVDKLRAVLLQRLDGLSRRRPGNPDAPAVILFTSGSEGEPKGVVLTHRNLLANCAQVAARVDFSPRDVVLNALPVFHSFGLTGGALLPILNGVRCLLYPNPLHYAAVPALAYAANATILFGSDTFLSGYARSAHPYDFYSLRYVFAGAEPVRPETRARFSEKFGVRIFEGYGVTECAPVIAVNTPMHAKIGTVGRLLPGLEARLEPVEGVEGAQRLFVRGPNVMAGYLRHERPGALQPPEGGWHDTGDLVAIDAEGFVSIRGRVKRFAKIGGEMVSLAAVEALAARRWPNAAHAVVTRPNAQKGEELVLFTTEPTAERGDFAAWARLTGVRDLAVPREIRRVEALAALAVGKTDYARLTALARTPATPCAPLGAHALETAQ